MGYYKLKKDLEPAAREGRKFWEVVTEFSRLSDKKKKEYMIHDLKLHIRGLYL